VKGRAVRLSYSPASPYVRKVVACAIARGLDGRLERVTTNPHESPAELLRMNPLSKVPTLLLGDGRALYDSRVMCEYLDGLGDAPPLFPVAGPARWAALRQQALGDGIMDASVPRRREMAFPMDEGRGAFMARQREAVARAVDALEAEAASFGDLRTIGEVAVGCALGYLDFRFAAEPWRPGHDRLAAWFARVSELPPLARTVPVG
jgi:glutathione S-transferase